MTREPIVDVKAAILSFIVSRRDRILSSRDERSGAVDVVSEGVYPGRVTSDPKSRR